MARNIRRATHAPLHRHALARAVRHALVIGLALAAGGPAMAGTCDVADPAAATCDGIFAGVGIGYAIEDLTLVVGGELPTTINPADGIAGIELSASYGHIELSSYADISTQGAAGIRLQTYSGDIGVANHGAIEAEGGNGIQAQSYYGDIDIANFGLVDASVVDYGNATGIRASNFFGDVSVYVGADASVSASSDVVYGGTATGVRASSYLGAVAVENLGDISASAHAEYGNATAYGVLARGGYYGITSVVNEGSISAEAATGSGVGWAWGVRVRGHEAELDNSGSIAAEAYAGSGYASASAAYVRGYTANSSNTGDIQAHAVVGGQGQALAYGTMTWGYYSELDNTGSVAAYAQVGSGTSVAMGANSYYDRALAVYNAGSFLGDSYAGLGFAEAVGVAGYAQQSSQIVNAYGGEIAAIAGVGNGYAFAYGILFHAGEYARLDNAGSITAEANTYASGAFQDAGGMARTIGASLVANTGDSLLYNAEGASIAATSSVHGQYGRAYAFGAVAQGGNQARVTNEGSILADAYAIVGSAISLGDLAYGTFAVNLNYGELSSQASVAGEGFAMAIGQYSFGEVSTVLNAGDSFTHADVGDGAAYAVGARLQGAWVAAYNEGLLQAEAQAGSGLASAQGIAAYGFYGASVDNNGELVANAAVGAGDALAVGAYAYAYVYGAYVSNAGSIAAAASADYGSASAFGAVAISYLFGSVAVYNQGEILASASGPGDASATGAALSLYDGYAIAYNSGHIGAVADSLGGMYGTAEATGLDIDNSFGKYNMPIAQVANYGDIEAIATRTGEQGFAQAAGASVFAMYASFYNAGEIVAEAIAVGDGAGSSAVTTLFSAKYGVDAHNSGGLHALASAEGGGSASAIGVIASAYYGSIFLHNDGEILAEASTSGGEYGGAAYASGASLHGGYVVALYNEGSIVAHASAQGGAEAVGFDGSGKYDIATVDNHGDILAYAQGYYASATGAVINSKYGARTDNDGLIAAYAQAGDGNAQATGSVVFAPGAHGYFDGAIGASLYNGGEILAEASAIAGQALAIGARVEGAQDAGAYTHNTGLIHASAGSASGAAFATGSNTWSYYGDVALMNAGDIGGEASAGADGSAAALGAQVRAEGFGPPGYPAGVATLYNAGAILASASTEAGDAFATAARLIGEQGSYADNLGELAAIAGSEGGLAYAAGLVLFSAYGDLQVTNSGSVLASADGASGSLATGVYLYSQGLNTLVNTGEIIATGVGSAHIAVQSSEYATALIDNSGLLAGSILTGALDDQLYNRAGAELWLGNDLIDLGGWSGLGNVFVNEGRIRVRGDGNAIDMGALEATLLPGANPLAFVNDGIIDFVDGDADDVLALAGDLSGHGTIAVDVDAAQLASDQLLIAGSVDPAAVQTLDVQLISLPTQASAAIVAVTVEGDATAGNFVLGEVHSAVDPGLLSLQFGLLADIDSSNQRADAFGLEVEVTGLSDAGALAAAIPASVARLLASQAGGERGLLLPDDGKGTHLWARVFHAKGGVSAGHEALDFGQGGNLDFEQRASGIEAGLDFAPNDAWRLGLLLFDLQASQRLRGAGSGQGELDGDGYGLYARWSAPWDLQLDAAWRHLRFDADVAGDTAGGGADSLDLQAAKAWTTASGLRVEPQLQFTHTRIDGVDLSVGDTHWQADDSGSDLARLGLGLSKSFGDEARRWTPFLGLSALHEFDGRSEYTINANFTGRESTRGSSARIEAGLDASFGALTLAGSLRWQDGAALDNAVDAQLSLYYRW